MSNERASRPAGASKSLVDELVEALEPRGLATDTATIAMQNLSLFALSFGWPRAVTRVDKATGTYGRTPARDPSDGFGSGGGKDEAKTDGTRSGPATFEELLRQMARGLCGQRRRHLLVTGRDGVGKSTLVRELAGRAALGEVCALSEKKFLRLDCRRISRADSRFFLTQAAVFARACVVGGRSPRCWRTEITPVEIQERQEVIARAEREGTSEMLRRMSSPGPAVLCLDDLGKLLRSEYEGTNKDLFRWLLMDPNLQIIGVLSRWDFDELLASDPAILELCTRIEVAEPDKALTLAIAESAVRRLADEFTVRIRQNAIEKAVTLTGIFIENPCWPAKAIRILEWACDAAAIDRAVGKRGRRASTITVKRVLRMIAAISGVPAKFLSTEIDGNE